MAGILKDIELYIASFAESEFAVEHHEECIDRAQEIGYSYNYRRDSKFFKMEYVFKNILTPKPELISKDTDPLPRLQYLPEDIAELIIRKKHLKKQCEENTHQNNKYLRRYNKVRQEIRTRIRQHAAVLKWFDIIIESQHSVTEKNHFSTSLDIARVQNLVNYYRQHEDDPFHMAKMMVTEEYTKDLVTGRKLEDKSEPLHFYYYWYAIYATYGDFVLAPPYYHEIFRYHHFEQVLCQVARKEKKRRKSAWFHLMQKYNLKKQNTEV